MKKDLEKSLGLAVPVLAFAALCSCGSGLEKGPGETPQQANLQAVAKKEPNCTRNVLYGVSGEAVRDCTVDGLRCSCNPKDRHGYFGCDCVDAAPIVAPDALALWSLRYEKGSLFIDSNDLERGASGIVMYTSVFAISDVEGDQRLHTWAPGNITRIDVGPLSLHEICRGELAQTCALALETESCPRTTDKACRSPVTLVVRLYNEKGVAVHDIRAPVNPVR